MWQGAIYATRYGCAYSQELFIGALVRERKRADRFEEAFVLVLVSLNSRAAPLLILLDDGWPAAASWDARLRSADELIARAEADNRGVAVLPLSETTRDISLQIADAGLGPKQAVAEREVNELLRLERCGDRERCPGFACGCGLGGA